MKKERLDWEGKGRMIRISGMGYFWTCARSDLTRAMGGPRGRAEPTTATIGPAAASWSLGANAAPDSYGGVTLRDRA